MSWTAELTRVVLAIPAHLEAISRRTSVTILRTTQDVAELVTG